MTTSSSIGLGSSMAPSPQFSGLVGSAGSSVQLSTAGGDAVLLAKHRAGLPAQLDEDGLAGLRPLPRVLPDQQPLPARQHGALAPVAEELDPLHHPRHQIRQGPG